MGAAAASGFNLEIGEVALQRSLEKILEGNLQEASLKLKEAEELLGKADDNLKINPDEATRQRADILRKQIEKAKEKIERLKIVMEVDMVSEPSISPEAQKILELEKTLLKPGDPQYDKIFNPQFGPGTLSTAEYIWDLIATLDPKNIAIAKRLLGENKGRVDVSLVEEFLKDTEKKLGIIEAKKELPEAQTGRITWNNIPFSPDTYIRTGRFKKAIKNFRSFHDRIERTIEQILLNPDEKYHKKIIAKSWQAKETYYAARVDKNFRIEFRIIKDEKGRPKIELTDFGKHTEILFGPGSKGQDEFIDDLIERGELEEAESRLKDQKIPNWDKLLQNLVYAKERAQVTEFPENPEQMSLEELAGQLFRVGYPLEGISTQVYIFYEKGVKKVLKANKIGDEITAVGSNDKTTLSNLKNEVKILESLREKPNINELIPSVEKTFKLKDGRLAVIESFVRGDRLADLIEKDLLSLDDLVNIVKTSIDIKSKLQKNGIYVFDWNQGNLHIEISGGKYIIRLVNFGESEITPSRKTKDDSAFGLWFENAILDFFEVKAYSLIKKGETNIVEKLKSDLVYLFGEDGEVLQNRNFRNRLENKANELK